MEEMGSSLGGVIGLLNPENLEKGDPKAIGKWLKLGADIFESRINDMDFQPWEMEKCKTGSRLKKAVQMYRKMAEEIEQMTEKHKIPFIHDDHTYRHNFKLI